MVLLRMTYACRDDHACTLYCLFQMDHSCQNGACAGCLLELVWVCYRLQGVYSLNRGIFFFCDASENARASAARSPLHT